MPGSKDAGALLELFNAAGQVRSLYIYVCSLVNPSAQLALHHSLKGTWARSCDRP